MAIPYEAGQAKIITATTIISTKPAILLGIWVTTSLASSRLWIANAVSSTASTASANVVRKFVSSVAKVMQYTPIECPTGLTVNMAGSAQTVTVVWRSTAGAPV